MSAAIWYLLTQSWDIMIASAGRRRRKFTYANMNVQPASKQGAVGHRGYDVIFISNSIQPILKRFCFFLILTIWNLFIAPLATLKIHADTELKNRMFQCCNWRTISLLPFIWVKLQINTWMFPKQGHQHRAQEKRSWHSVGRETGCLLVPCMASFLCLCFHS